MSPSAEIETLILRFRDLVTPAHGTIQSHSDIAEQSGFVWWGWWNKLGEVVPAHTFQRLNQRFKSAGGEQIFLFDSGHEIIYSANCEEIRWSQDLSRTLTPEVSATPAYYRDTRYLAWFKLTVINRYPIDAEVLCSFSYVDIGDFFTPGVSHYQDFDGKIVYSPNELRQQDRTIWFVRASRADDPRHEIRLLGAQQLTPAHFITRFREADTDAVLWVSDVHFSETAGNHGFAESSTLARLDLAASLERDLKTMDIQRLAAVMVSGDLTWRASQNEYHRSFKFIRDIQSWSNVDNYEVVICPGNHDIAFSRDPSAKGEPVDRASDEARHNYEQLYRDLYYLSPNSFLSCGRRLLLARTFPIEIVSLNSTLLDQAPALFQGHGFVGDEQLHDVATQFQWRENDDGPRPFRVVMVHHHVVPVTHRELPQAGAMYSVVLDAGALTRWAVRFRVDLILHGHMHQPFAAALDLPVKTLGSIQTWHRINVVGLGSTGADRRHLGEIGRNTFALLRFGERGAKVAVYVIDPIRGREKSEEPYFSVEVPYAWSAAARIGS